LPTQELKQTEISPPKVDSKLTNYKHGKENLRCSEPHIFVHLFFIFRLTTIN